MGQVRSNTNIFQRKYCKRLLDYLQISRIFCKHMSGQELLFNTANFSAFLNMI